MRYAYICKEEPDMTRATKASRAAHLEHLQSLARPLGLDARLCTSGMYEGFVEVYRPSTDEQLAAGVQLEPWLEGYAQAFEDLSPPTHEVV